MNPKRPTPRYIIIKMPAFKDKERILETAREKQIVTYKGTPIKITSEFSMDRLKDKREWQEIFQIMKSKGHDYSTPRGCHLKWKAM